MAKITLKMAEIIVEGALRKAAELDLKPMSIAVLDDGGNLKAFKRQDGPGAAMRPLLAIGKAFAAVGMGAAGTRLWEAQATERPHFVQGLIGLAQGKFIPGRGGVIVMNEHGEVIGAVGCTGDHPDNDEAIAVAGIEAAGLLYDTGEQAAASSTEAQEPPAYGSHTVE